MVLLYISRKVFEQLKNREGCDYTGWVNTADTEICMHSIRILTYRLTLDDLHDFGY